MSTTNKVVLLVGDSPLYDELKLLVSAAGHTVVTLEEAQVGTVVDLAVEVTNVDLAAKQALMTMLDQLLPLEVPIITTSLAISATEAASWTNHPERVCGFGTLVPLEERELFEVAPALQTAEAVIGQVTDFFSSLGKETELVEDEAGLVFPRILALIINEAVFALMEKTATPADIDTAMKKGTNYPYGPLEWADRIGLDEIYSIIRGLQRDLAEERYRPASLLRKLVLAGRVGQRSGRGFYYYGEKECSGS